MASRARKFPFLSSIITFLSISTKGNSANSPPPPCAAFDCGNGLTVGYPFHLQNHQLPLCGYTDFAISCTDNQPILHISNQSFTVKSLNTSENSITVTYGGYAATLTCPTVDQGVTLGYDSLLNYTSIDNKIVHFFYNCTVYPPSVPDIKCLQRGAKHSYAFVDGSVPKFDWIQHCESMAAVPVLTRNDVGDVVDALKLGFKLRWKSVDRSCEVCEESGGFCGYGSKSDDRKFICYCSHGKHSSLSCHGQGHEVSETSQRNYVAIGVVIFGGLLSIITVFVFLVKKKKNGMEKHGFSQIPTIYGK